MMKARELPKKLAERYGQHIEFNRNVLLAGSASLLGSMGCAELADYLYSDSALTATAATLSEAVFYASVYLPLHYRMKREEFAREGMLSYWKDIGKFALAAVPSMLVFYPVFSMGTYKMLGWEFRPFVSAVAAYAAASVPAQALMTYMAHRLGILNSNAGGGMR